MQQARNPRFSLEETLAQQNAEEQLTRTEAAADLQRDGFVSQRTWERIAAFYRNWHQYPFNDILPYEDVVGEGKNSPPYPHVNRATELLRNRTMAAIASDKIEMPGFDSEPAQFADK